MGKKLGTEGQAASCLKPRGSARLEPDFDERVFTVTGTLVPLKLGQGGVLSAQGLMLKESNYPPTDSP